MRSLIFVPMRLIFREFHVHCNLRTLIIPIFFIFIYIFYYFIVASIAPLYDVARENTDLASQGIQSNYFIYYPASRGFEEMQQMRLSSINDHNSTQSLSNHFHKYEFSLLNISSKWRSKHKTTSLPYSETLFHNADFPVLWLDSYGEVRWNKAAEQEMYRYLILKQFPPLQTQPTSENLAKSFIQDCHLQQILILEQWRDGGFVSRLNCLIDQFGQSLYSPRMTVLGPRQFTVHSSAKEDFLEEGLLGYISPISRCCAYMYHPAMTDIKDTIYKIVSDVPQQRRFLRIQTFAHLRQRSNIPFLHLPHIWKFGYEHVPHRRWLFDFDRKRAIDFVYYSSLNEVLMQHDEEHIYRAPGIQFNYRTWQANNSPYYASNESFQSDYTITWKDKVFTSFIRYMVTLYVHQFPPRIQISTKLLTLYWAKYLEDKNRQPYNATLNNMAGIYIRRGDKMPEDSFWQKHRHWRNISLYIKGLVDEENRRKKAFSSIFIMTDDASAMNSILEYASTKSNSSEEAYAQRFLYGRQILYNVFAPQSCFNPFTRIGFDQFLVSMNFLVEHASFIVSHTDSNVGRYIERLIYAKHQLTENKTFRTNDFVKNAPDNLD